MARRFPQGQLDKLRTIPLFARFTDRELEKIDQLVDEIEVPAGEVLTHQGSYDTQESFVIVEGEVSVEVDGRRVATLGPGSLFGEMAMLDQKPRSATVIARTAMRLLIIGPAAFTTFIAQPAISMTVMKSMAERMRTVDARFAQSASDTEQGAA